MVNRWVDINKELPPAEELVLFVARVFDDDSNLYSVYTGSRHGDYYSKNDGRALSRSDILAWMSIVPFEGTPELKFDEVASIYKPSKHYYAITKS